MKTFFVFLASFFILTSCVKNNESVVWLKVAAWQIVENGTGNDGVMSENITDAWVYIDDRLVGVFEVPFKIPFLEPGSNKKITIYPTIRNNGIAATKKIYPFLEPYIITRDLIKNDTIEISPVTKYFTSTQFHIVDFTDGTNIGFLEGINSAASIIQENDPLVLQPLNEGNFGRVILNSSFPNWSARTTFAAIPAFPQSGAEVYLEVDYYTTLDVVTGVVSFHNGDVAENPNVQFNAQAASEVVWKKIYIDMKTIISGSPGGSDFEITFESLLPGGVTSGEINIDNVKVVHF